MQLVFQETKCIFLIDLNLKNQMWLVATILAERVYMIYGYIHAWKYKNFEEEYTPTSG